MGALAATTMIFVQAGISLCLLGFATAGVKPDLNATKIVSDKNTAPILVSDKDTAPKIVSDKDIAPKKLIEGSAGVAAQLFETHGVVPDVIDKAPPAIAKIVYPNGVIVDIGKELTPTQVKDQPTVTWDAEDGAFYTLCMTDPDAPSRKEPKLREWQHWLVGNIPEKDVSKGEVLSAYIGSGPPPDTGLHRYVYLIYKQPGQLKFDEKRLTNTSAENREKFSTKNFAAKYKLGDPIAGNLYLAQYDDYVPILYKQLGE